jgi:hypothetical protein
MYLLLDPNIYAVSGGWLYSCAQIIIPTDRHRQY